MTVAEALRWLESRAQAKCDQRSLNWSMVDVEAVHVILKAIKG